MAVFVVAASFPPFLYYRVITQKRQISIRKIVAKEHKKYTSRNTYSLGRPCGGTGRETDSTAVEDTA
jgi:hypothetical protein